MKTFAALIMFLMLSMSTTAQWFWQNPLPQGNSLNSVKFISSTTGWTVGKGGTLLKTTDSGTTWQLQPGSSTVSLNGVPLINDNKRIAGGDIGTILKKTNDGILKLAMARNR